MRRTGSEEIGSSKALGRAGMIPGLPRLLLLVIFLVKLQSGGLGSQNTTMPGALCPASSSLLCFIGWSYPQIVLYSRISKHVRIAIPAITDRQGCFFRTIPCQQYYSRSPNSVNVYEIGRLPSLL